MVIMIDKIPEEVVNATEVIKEFCYQYDFCENCPMYDEVGLRDCLLGANPARWSIGL